MTKIRSAIDRNAADVSNTLSGLLIPHCLKRLLPLLMIALLSGCASADLIKDYNMTDTERVLARINTLLAEHPASEPLCGIKKSRLSRKGDMLVLETSWTKCPGMDRSVVGIGNLDAARISSELQERYGQARVFLFCTGGTPCSGRFTRNADEDHWRHVRDEPVFAVDCAPDADVLGELVDGFRDWLSKQHPEHNP